MTEAAWKQQLAATHPDRSGESETFLAVIAARAAWRQTHATCPRCGHMFTPSPFRSGQPQKYCTQHCAVRAVTGARRKRYLR